MTEIPVLGGLGAGKTCTVRVVVPPVATEFGFAEPTPERIAQLFVGDELLRGFGVPSAKLFALSLVSRQPLSPLSAAVVFVSVGAAPGPSKQFAAPYPTKSMIAGSEGHTPVNATVLFTNATLPEVEPTAIEPVASGVGSSSVPPRPAASLIK